MFNADAGKGRPFPICLIVAMDQARVIGAGNQLPWHIPEDMKRFARLTTGQTVLMGRKTYQSLPEKFRPLPKRKNIVVSRDPAALQLPGDVSVFESPQAAIDHLDREPAQLLGNQLWVIGGGEIYRETLPLVDQIFLTLVDGKHAGDVFFPDFEEQFDLVESESHVGYEYRHYQRR